MYVQPQATPLPPSCPPFSREASPTPSTPHTSVHCGNDDPAYHEEVNRPPVVVPQAYHPAEEGRELQTKTNQNYGEGSSSTMLPNLKATAQPIRILAIWDTVEKTGDRGVCEGQTWSSSLRPRALTSARRTQARTCW